MFCKVVCQSGVIQRRIPPSDFNVNAASFCKYSTKTNSLGARLGGFYGKLCLIANDFPNNILIVYMRSVFLAVHHHTVPMSLLSCNVYVFFREKLKSWTVSMKCAFCCFVNSEKVWEWQSFRVELIVQASLSEANQFTVWSHGIILFPTDFLSVLHLFI